MNRSLSHPLHSNSSNSSISSSSSSSSSPLSTRFFMQLNGEVFDLIFDVLFGKWNSGPIFWGRVRISAVGAQKRYSGLPILIFPFIPKEIILGLLNFYISKSYIFSLSSEGAGLLPAAVNLHLLHPDPHSWLFTCLHYLELGLVLF